MMPAQARSIASGSFSDCDANHSFLAHRVRRGITLRQLLRERRSQPGQRPTGRPANTLVQRTKPNYARVGEGNSALLGRLGNFTRFAL
jgi:hypothetical protein